MLCIWKFTQSKYKAPFSVWQWKKNCKTCNFFLNVIYFDAFFVIHVLHVIFFFLIFFLCSWCWNVVRWEGWERQKHTTEQADVSLHYCIQEWQWGLGVGGGLEVRTKNQRRYVQPPLWTGNRAAAIWWPVMPPNATYFSCFFIGFFLYFFKHTNNSHYIILPN